MVHWPFKTAVSKKYTYKRARLWIEFGSQGGLCCPDGNTAFFHWKGIMGDVIRCGEILQVFYDCSQGQLFHVWNAALACTGPGWLAG